MTLTAPLEHSAATFWQQFHATADPVERRRAQFLALLAEGRPMGEILQTTGYSRVTAYALVRRYRERGLGALRDGRQDNRGAPRLLTDGQRRALHDRLQADAGRGVLWSGRDVQTWLREQYGLAVHLGRTYELLRDAGLTPRGARTRPDAADPATPAPGDTD
jgi:transposase